MKQNLLNYSELTTQKKWLFFIIFFCLLIVDRVNTLIHFGFVYTDLDQMVMWNGALDYSQGIFHEPFFYGQPYSYMLESLVAVPLLWLHIPIDVAMPISTSMISSMPFILLAIILFNRNYHHWAYLSLAFPVILPIPYNFLTTISRGFVQAHVFVPFLFIPLFNPTHKKNVTLLYIISALSLIANPSSILIVFPIALYVYTYHYQSRSFYIKSLLVIPFFILNDLAKTYYKIHPESVLHSYDLTFDKHTFLNSLSQPNHFENLFPFFSSAGILYPLVFIILAVIAYKKSMKKESILIVSIIILLLITFAIPKVQEVYHQAGIFFTSSRLYLFLPVLLLISLFLIFKNNFCYNLTYYIILLICVGSLIFKSYNIKQTAQQTIAQTLFPVKKNQDLKNRAYELKTLADQNQIGIMVHGTTEVWDYIFDSYAFDPLTHDMPKTNKNVVSVNLNGDRRSWLYNDSTIYKNILIHGIKIDSILLKNFEYKQLSQDKIIIQNNRLQLPELFKQLKLTYGNKKL